jgi:DNA processing protein
MYKYWVWLSTIKGVGPVTAKRLLNHFHAPERIYYAAKKELLEVENIGEATSEKIISSRSLSCATDIIENCRKHNINILCLDDPLYPDIVKNINKLPILLYFKGELIKNSIGVGIVGTRRCTEYGKRAAIESAEFLSKHNIPVISGMAKGIDSYAHTACLNSGGYTIAVLGNGVDICYPKEHAELMKNIEQKGCVISEYTPGTKPIAEYFPERNKIIAAWSSKLLVVEAGEKSGALITAEYAKKFSREIFAVPNSIYAKEGLGTNKLIQNDAALYFTPTQLLPKNIPIESRIANPKAKQDETGMSFTSLEYKIIRELSSKSLTIDELILILRDYKHNLIETISMMELEGKIKSNIGGKLTLP